MLPAKPKSRYEKEENGLTVIDVGKLLSEPYQENPEFKEWERQYAAEYDRLSEIEAAKYPRRWGRWYLDAGYLCTKIMRPQEGNRPGGSYGVYDFLLNRCRTNQDRAAWIEHMADKNWMGEKGLSDLQKAFNDLVKGGFIKND